MKNLRLGAAILGAACVSLLAGCATLPQTGQARRAARPATYAVIATDTKGMLSAADFHKVEVGVIQYLLDEGYVRAGEKYVTDVMHADIVFRVRIAWQGTEGGFTVAEVVPSYSAAPPPPGGYAGGGSAAYAPGYEGGGWYDGSWWNNDPWWYDDGYGAFGGLYPFVPIYAWNLHRRDRGDRDPRDHDHRSPAGHPRSPSPWWHHGDSRDPAPHPARWDRHDRDGDRHADHPSRSRDWAHVPTDRRPAPVSQYQPGSDHDRAGPWLRRDPVPTGRAPMRSFSPPPAAAPPPRAYSPPVRAYAAPARSYSPPPPPPPTAPPPPAPAARAGNQDSNTRGDRQR